MNDIVTIDCRGMRCPAPILKLAKTARGAGKTPLTLEILADDGDFPNDLDAWCRTAKATVHEVIDEDGVTRAVVGLNGAPGRSTTSASPPNSTAPNASPPERPAFTPRSAPPRARNGAPTTQVAQTVQPTPAAIATPIASPAAVAAPIASPAAAANGIPSADLDLRGLQAPHPILKLSEALAQRPGQLLTVHADDPSFLADLMGWAAATRVVVRSTQSNAQGALVELQLPGQPQAIIAASEALPVAPAPALQALAPVEQTLPATVDDDIPKRENLATLLVIHNDFESLMAALMVASTSAAQGMDVCVYFSFWGVNLLRGEKPRKDEKSSGISFLQKMMKWMMPRGPSRQKMSQMHMGGVGKGMMQHFMRKNNVMSLEQLIESCVEQDVRFVVCSMSMGIMGIERRDIMDLSNIEFAGVTCFTEMARKSAMSLTF